MKKTKFLKRLTAFVLTLSMTIPYGAGKFQSVSAEENSKTRSLIYVEAMGKGWNLGNTFESINTDDYIKSDETAWGNPKVTPEFLRSIKAKGFDSIRLPIAATTRYTYMWSGHFEINKSFLSRYKEVVDQAVDAGLYVMIDLHDVWCWLSKHWDGNTSSAEYRMFVDFWTQIANTFKDEPSVVCFETGNELGFDDAKKYEKMDALNQAAHDIIRKSGGNNATRMIVIPTLWTNSADGNSDKTYNFIAGLKDNRGNQDKNIIATVHNYSDWVFSANLGKTGFDEDLWGGGNYSPRDGVNQFYDTIDKAFTSKGVGVIVGEYGLLRDDANRRTNQLGEKLKYFELMNYMSTKNGVCLMLWDNGSILDRNDTVNYSWKQPPVQAIIDAAIRGERSSYATGLNEIYLSQPVTSGVKIPLTLNGNTFKGIDGLAEGKDYSYDATTGTVTLSKDFVNSKFNAFEQDKYGDMADLVIKFSKGADWHQYLIKYTAPELKTTIGTTSSFNIPVDFNGTVLRRAVANKVNDDGTDGSKVGPHSGWWSYLEYGNTFVADYDKNTISILPGFFNDGSVSAIEKIKFSFEFYDGQKINYILTKTGPIVKGIIAVK